MMHHTVGDTDPILNVTCALWSIIAQQYWSLAQRLEHYFDVVEIMSSILIGPTISGHRLNGLGPMTFNHDNRGSNPLGRTISHGFA